MFQNSSNVDIEFAHLSVVSYSVTASRKFGVTTIHRFLALELGICSTPWMQSCRPVLFIHSGLNYKTTLRPPYWWASYVESSFLNRLYQRLRHSKKTKSCLLNCDSIFRDLFQLNLVLDSPFGADFTMNSQLFTLQLWKIMRCSNSSR